MKYGDLYRIIEFNEDVIKKIDSTISNMDLPIENSSLKINNPSRRDPNLRISKQAWIREKSFCKYFFDIGNIKIQFIHTPGHTLESSSLLLFDEEGLQHSIFTGDTLFQGDVGIPDVAQRYKGLSKEKLAAILYESINNKIKPLDDEIIIYPGHGAGSACGKNMMKETVDTLKNQKKTHTSGPEPAQQASPDRRTGLPVRRYGIIPTTNLKK